MSIDRFFALTACLLGTPLLVGCLFGGPGRVDAPTMDPEVMADDCMKQADEDGDGLITEKEAKANAPGLAYAFRQLDTDGDKKLSRDEVLTRFKDYVDSKVGVNGFNCFITLKTGQPLVDGHIRLVPEPFMGDVVEEAEGDVIDESTGMAEATFPNEEGLFGVRAGMYRVEITSPSYKVGKKYNEETTLGVEVSPFTNPFEDPGGIRFKVGK